MNFALVYIINRFFYRIFNFFHHWYFDVSRNFAHAFITTLERLDKTIAIRVTFKYFFQPLYKDYSFIGRFLGIIFRTIRIFIGLIVYCLIALGFIAAYLAWLFIPILISAYAIKNI